MTAAAQDSNERRRITLQLPNHLVAGIDRLRIEWGLRSRGDTVERLLGELLVEHNEEGSADEDPSDVGHGEAEAEVFDEGGALVLIAQRRNGGIGADFIESDQSSEQRSQGRPTQGSSGIDLPGFVRRQSEQLRRSLGATASTPVSDRQRLALLDQSNLTTALTTAQQHWYDLYGTPPNDHVLEAAMGWLAKEIWPQVDQSEGRPFTWSLACRIASEYAPSWPCDPPSFDRVMVMAGLLEDPFSSDTLSVRIPTLIRRFVHRMRKRQRGMSFETLENTMSLHGALKLLHLPTAPGHRLTLADIREAYREQALQHHPDSGGSVDQMRRLNEAYQMLKELYRSTN